MFLSLKLLLTRKTINLNNAKIMINFSLSLLLLLGNCVIVSQSSSLLAANDENDGSKFDGGSHRHIDHRVVVIDHRDVVVDRSNEKIEQQYQQLNEPVQNVVIKDEYNANRPSWAIPAGTHQEEQVDDGRLVAGKILFNSDDRFPPDHHTDHHQHRHHPQQQQQQQQQQLQRQQIRLRHHHSRLNDLLRLNQQRQQFEQFSHQRRLSYGMPNVCEKKAVQFRRQWKVCRKSRLGPFITYRSYNCTGSEENVEGKGCLRHERRPIYYDTLEPVIVPDVQSEASCCRGWYRLGSNDFGCPYRSCNSECGNPSSLCRPGIFGHRCRCRPGLQGPNCDIDVDECATQGNGGCEEICQNTYGSYLCSCKLPRRLANDGLSCIGGITEVEVDHMGRPIKRKGVAGSSHRTRNRTSSSPPSLKPGELRGNASSLKASSSSSSSLSSSSTPASLTSLTTSDDGLSASAAPFYSCAVHNGGCAHICRRRQHFTSSERRSVLCDCFPGFRLAQDGRSCEDIDECVETKASATRLNSAEEPLRIYSFEDMAHDDDEERQTAKSAAGCSQICRNTVGSFDCQCYQGFEIHSDGLTCIQTAPDSELFIDGDEERSNSSLPSSSISHQQGRFKLPASSVSVRAGNYHQQMRTGAQRTSLRASPMVDDYEAEVPSLDDEFSEPFSSSSSSSASSSSSLFSDVTSSCLDRNGGCQQICQDTPAGVVCSCTSGYRLDGNNTGCLDVDECTTGTHCCAESCFNTPGSFKCDCRKGFRLAADGCGCIDINECLENVKSRKTDSINGGEQQQTTAQLCDHICINSDGSYRCACRVGYHLSPSDRSTCIKDSYSSDSSMSSNSSTYIAPFLYPAASESSAQRHLSPAMSSSKIRVESIAFVPHLLKPYDSNNLLSQLVFDNKTFIFKFKPCTKGFYGANCSRACGPCRHNASCDSENGTCLCPRGTSGDRCQIGCPTGMYGPPDCLHRCSSKCLSGECDPELGFCQCQPGHFGPRCIPCPAWRYGQFCEAECDCNQEHTEACNATNGQCICRPGFYSAKCDTPCAAGYYGSNCSSTCPEDCSLLCDPVSGHCPKHACSNGFYGDDCSLTCPQGHYGPNCAQMCLDCAPYGCDPATGRCVCPPGKKGPQCNQDCDFGYYGSECSQQCNCSIPFPPQTGQVGADGYSFEQQASYGSAKYADEMISPVNNQHYPDHQIARYESVGCDPATGFCYCPTGTRFSSQYQRCDPCEDGFYGTNCAEQCQCPPAPEDEPVVLREYVPSPQSFNNNNNKNSSSNHTNMTNNSDDDNNYGHFSKACNPISGKCVCKPGYRGFNCDQPCAAGSYGQGCHYKCQCGRNGDCAHTNGRCICASGWTGEKCEEPCPPGMFGANCSQNCECRNENATCDPVTGTCICPTGYIGRTCEQPCAPGFYGADCQRKCQCGYSKCHHVTGICIQSPSMEERLGSLTFNQNNGNRMNDGDEVSRKQLEEQQQQQQQQQQNYEALPDQAVASGSMVGVDAAGSGQGHVDANTDDSGVVTTRSDQGAGRSDEERTGQHHHHRHNHGRVLETMILSSNNSEQQDAIENNNNGNDNNGDDPNNDDSNHRRHRHSYRRQQQQQQGGKQTSMNRYERKRANGNNQNGVAASSNKKSVAFASSREVEVRSVKELVEGEQMLVVSPDQPAGARSSSSTPAPCPAPYFGPACQDICLCRANGTCDAKGQCRCKPGFIGPLCEHECPPNFYGQDCSKRCRCQQTGSTCHHETGQCDCAPGWTGKHCSKACPAGKFGRNCAHSCQNVNCHHERSSGCDRVDGTCICNSGYSGPTCSEPCPPGTYGPRCNKTCACHNGGLCSHLTGCCDCQRPGFVGPLCEHECDSGFWGVNCNKSCTPACRSGHCDRETGRCIGTAVNGNGNNHNNNNNNNYARPYQRQNYGDEKALPLPRDSPAPAANNNHHHRHHSYENNSNGMAMELLTGPAETSRSGEMPMRRPPLRQHISSPRSLQLPNSVMHRCPPYHYGPDCSLMCSNCLPPPHSKGCDRRTGRCRCQKGWLGPHCDMISSHAADFDRGRADVAPSSYIQHAAADISSISSSTERLPYQDQEAPRNPYHQPRREMSL